MSVSILALKIFSERTVRNRLLTAWILLIIPTLIRADEKVLTRIAFGSCAFQPHAQPICTRIAEAQPPLCL